MLLFLFTILIFIKSSHGFTQNATVIEDLQSTDPAAFQAESIPWSVSYQLCSSCPKTFKIPPNTCGLPELPVYGGPGVLGPASSASGQSLQRTYQNIPSSYAWKGLEFDAYVFYDSPQTTAPGIVNILDVPTNDDSTFLSATVVAACSLDYSDDAQGIVVKYLYKYHVRVYIWISSGDSISTLMFKTFLSTPSLTSSYGIRDIKLYIQSASVGVTNILNFPCEVNNYWTGSLCSPCNSACQACSGPTSNDCTSCTSGYSYQNNSCLGTCSGVFQPVSINGFSGFCREKCSSGFYFISDGTCIQNCDAPLKQAVDENHITVCNNPCFSTTSGLSNYRFPDGSCSTCSSPNKPLSHYICQGPCDDPLDYYFQNTSCLSACPSPLKSSTPLGVRSCDSPCPNKFIFHNTSCFANCPVPLVPEEYYTIKYCHNPCLTSSDGPFLYPNGACKNDCPLPLLTRNEPDVQFCFNPCQPSQYLFENSKCLTDCVAPLVNPLRKRICPQRVKQIEPYVQYCRNPCYGTDNFLYPNGSCISTCSFPLSSRLEPGLKYCENPCPIDSQFLYPNQSCLETCSSPNFIKNEPIANFCRYPCPDPSYYFYLTDESCQKTCPYPYKATDSPLPKLCTSELSEEEIKEIKKLADTTEAANSAASTGTLIWSVVSSSDSTAACMGPIAKMLQYIRFMDITFPAKVQLMLDQQNIKANTPGFAKKMVKSALANFPKNDLPGKFETSQIPSSFFVNFWPAFFNLSVILFVTLLVIFTTISSKSSPKLHGILKNLMEILKWNVLLVTFCGSLGDVVLFTALELQSIQFESAQAGISFALCIIMNGFSIFVVIKILEVNLALRKSKQNLTGNDLERQKQKIEQEWVSYKSFFQCYRDHSYFQQIFLFIFVIRLVIFNGIIGYLFKNPLFQAIIITLLNIAMLLYLAIKRPMRKLFSLIQQIILELVLLPFNISVLILAIMDHNEIEEFEQRKNLGDVIVYINVIIPILSLVLMACKFLVIGYEFYMIWKLRKAAKLNPQMKKVRESSRTRHQGVTLHTTTQEISQTQTLNSQITNNRSLMDQTQIFDVNDQSTLSISHDASNMSFTSPLNPPQRLMRNDSVNFVSQPQRRGFIQQKNLQQRMLHMFQNGQFEKMDWESPGNNRRRIQRRKNRIQKQDLITIEPDLKR